MFLIEEKKLNEEFDFTCKNNTFLNYAYDLYSNKKYGAAVINILFLFFKIFNI